MTIDWQDVKDVYDKLPETYMPASRGKDWAEFYGAVCDEQGWRAKTTQFGTGIHYPHCKVSLCTGCLPDLREDPDLLGVPQVESGIVPEGAALGVTDEQRADLRKRMADMIGWQ